MPRSCCWRETINGSEYCIWHADPKEVSKPIDQLKKALNSPEVREQKSNYTELLNGAKLPGIKFEDSISFEGVALRNSNLSGADLRNADLSGADLQNADLSDSNLQNGDLSGADLQNADLSDSNIVLANLSEANLLFSDLSGSALSGSNFSKIKLHHTDLSGTSLDSINFSNADLSEADFSNARLGGANLSGLNLAFSDLSGAILLSADFSDADLQNADLSNTNLKNADLSGADLSEVDLSDADLTGSNLIGTNVEHAVFIRTNLFDTNLTNMMSHGATFTDVQINDDTTFRSKENRKEESCWWQKGPFFPPLRCGYDPAIRAEAHESNTVQLGKAADTYQTFETLARENARPSLQSEMFVLRQDMQRKRHWHNNEYFDWGFARVSRTIFKHGESLGRIFFSAILVVFVYGIFYAHFDLITDVDGNFVSDPVDALYFSTLTFTTLGLGDFQPLPASETARMLVTSQAALGAILIAIFVFVLGRRAAR